MKDNQDLRNPTNSLPILMQNTSENLNYFDYYDDEDMEIINEIYGEEIELHKDMD